MTLKIRVLKNERDYDAALERLSALMSMRRPAGSDLEAEFELLCLVIGDYEAKRTTEPQVTAIEAIEFRMAQQKLTRKDMEPYLGSPSKVSEVMSGKLPLSIQMIRRLHNGLGIPARALIADVSGLGSSGEPSEPDLDVQKFPLKEMSDRGLLPAIDGRGQKAQEHAAAEVKKFLARVAGLAKEPAFLRARLFQSGGRTMDDCALLVWRAAVVQKASRFPPKKAFVPGLINNTWLRKLAQKSKHENGPQLAREYLSAHGICLVVEERFKKTYLDGAAMMAAGAPIVALTLRHDRLDNFWFALLHEMVHIQKHLNNDHLFIADNLDDKARKGQIQEDEADAGAQEALIPSSMWEKSRVRLSHSTEDAIDLAREAGVHPCIVAGRVRHNTGNWRLLSSLITAAGSVKPYFEDQLQ